MGEGVAMRHTCNRRVEDAEEVGPPRGGPPGWRGVGPLSALSAHSIPTIRAKEPRQQSAHKHATAQTLRLVCPLDPLEYGYPMLICSAGTR